MAAEKATTEGVIARVGRWCYRRRWWVTLGWLAVLAVGVIAGAAVAGRVVVEPPAAHDESYQGQQILDRSRDSSGNVIAVVNGVDPHAPGVREAVQRATDDLVGRGDVRKVESPYSAGGEPTRSYLSSDGSGLVVVTTVERLNAAQRDAAVDAVRARMQRLVTDLRNVGENDAEAKVGGLPAVLTDAARTGNTDLLRGEAVALPITLIVLVLVFGSLLAGAMPLVTAVVTTGASLVLVLGFSVATGVSSEVLSVVTVLGLALSIDYALLLVGRYREELFAGYDPETAVGRAWATAGRTVMFSSLIMGTALSGLLAFRLVTLRTFGIAGVSVAAVTAIVSLTFTAALLGFAGRRIKPAPPATHHRATRRALMFAGSFIRMATAAQRRPWLVVLASGALLLVAAAPLLTAQIRIPGLAELPRSMESIQAGDDLGKRFDRPYTPLVSVIARTDPATLDSWAKRFAGDPAAAQVRPAVALANEPGTSLVEIAVKGDPSSDAAQDLVRRIRADRPPGGQSWIVSVAADLIDLAGAVRRDLPYVIAISLIAIFVLLFAMTGSLVIPVKAILANLVSLGAAFGVMNAIFVKGFLAGPLDTITVNGFDPLVVITVLAFAFALSVDYEVFLLGRISERVQAERGGAESIEPERLARVTDTAVREGLQNTGRIITTAALLIGIVFAGFAAAKTSGIEEVGIGIAVAVLIDATLVRCFLVPATMTLLGRWNWWAPAPLMRLHERIGLRERPLPGPGAGQAKTAPDEAAAGKSVYAS